MFLIYIYDKLPFKMLYLVLQKYPKSDYAALMPFGYYIWLYILYILLIALNNLAMFCTCWLCDDVISTDIGVVNI